MKHGTALIKTLAELMETQVKIKIKRKTVCTQSELSEPSNFLLDFGEGHHKSEGEDGWCCVILIFGTSQSPSLSPTHSAPWKWVEIVGEKW